MHNQSGTIAAPNQLEFQSQTMDNSEAIEREQHFHDDWAATIRPEDVEVIKSFEGATSPEGKWIVSRLGDLAGKKVLELGSGAGEGAVYFAVKGADVTATDLSPGMLSVVEKVAAHNGVTLATRVCSATDLSQFPDNSFDIVYGANVLHHVDIVPCLDEVRRVLKPGGHGAFWDPVQHNPAINIYRRMAADVRTPDEHPIRRSDMRLFRERFAEIETRFFWLSALVVFLRFYLIDRINPSEDRYWKLLVSRENELRGFVRPFFAIDRFLLAIMPIMGWWCWNIGVLVRKQRGQEVEYRS